MSTTESPELRHSSRLKTKIKRYQSDETLPVRRSRRLLFENVYVSDNDDELTDFERACQMSRISCSSAVAASRSTVKEDEKKLCGAKDKSPKMRQRMLLMEIIIEIASRRQLRDESTTKESDTNLMQRAVADVLMRKHHLNELADFMTLKTMKLWTFDELLSAVKDLCQSKVDIMEMEQIIIKIDDAIHTTEKVSFLALLTNKLNKKGQEFHNHCEHDLSTHTHDGCLVVIDPVHLEEGDTPAQIRENLRELGSRLTEAYAQTVLLEKRLTSSCLESITPNTCHCLIRARGSLDRASSLVDRILELYDKPDPTGSEKGLGSEKSYAEALSALHNVKVHAGDAREFLRSIGGDEVAVIIEEHLAAVFAKANRLICQTARLRTYLQQLPSYIQNLYDFLSVEE